MSINHVKSKQRIKDHGEVFTPDFIVNDMLDLVKNETERIESRFLEPACGDGNFLAPILERKLEVVKKKYKSSKVEFERNALLAVSSIYGVELLHDNVSACIERLCKIVDDVYSKLYKDKCNADFRKSVRFVLNRNILQGNALDLKTADGKEHIIHNNLPNDVIIGNPPYQMSDGGGTGSSAIPLYHKFVEQAKKLSPRYLTMIIPSRWFTGGKGLDDFRDTMLKDNCLREIHDFLDASECFSGVSIEGGVCYFLWKRDDKGLCMVHTHSSNGILSMTERPLLEQDADVFIRYNEAISIIRKVNAEKEDNFSNLVGPRNPYGIGNEVLTGNFSERAKKIKVLGVLKSKRVIKKIPLAQLGRNIDELNSYRLFISKADGAAGQIGNPIPARIIGKIVVAEPDMACTETFLRIGAFNNEQEALHAKQYMETNFFRVLVGARKNKNMTRGTYSFVPLQDFSESWTDEKLYKKYKLTKKEIEFIESMICPMN